MTQNVLDRPLVPSHVGPPEPEAVRERERRDRHQQAGRHPGSRHDFLERPLRRRLLALRQQA